MFAKPLTHINRNLLSIFCCFLIITVTWTSVCLNNSPIALAKPMVERNVETFDSAIASQPTVMNNLKSQVKDDLKAESGSVTGDTGFAGSTVENNRLVVEQAQRNFNEPAKQVEIIGIATDKQSKENVAKIQGKAANSEFDVGNVVRDVTSNIRNKVN